MSREVRLIGWVMAAALVAMPSPAGNSGAVKSALKQVSQATEGLRGAVADVEYSQVVGKRSIDGSGKLYVHYAGALRIEIGGDEPRTILFSRPLLYIHRHSEQVVEIYDVTSNPHRLGQYVMLGFVPNGRALTVRFDVQLIENSTLDGKPVFNFLLIPKPKKAPATAEAIARIQLWVDPDSGLPVRHEIDHAIGEDKLTVRYLDISREDELPDSLFRPVWPDGVKLVHK